MPQELGFIFYPHDWLADEKLGLCSLATKGAWMDLICYMYKSKRRGYMIVNDKPLTKDDIRLLLKFRGDQEFELIWSELLSNGVMSQHADGAYYSKRVVEDAEKMVPRSGISQEESELIDNVLEQFNVLTKYRASYDVNEAKDLIALRIKDDGAKLDDFLNVINSKYEEWKDDERMKKHIKPFILFGDKFKRYLHESKPQLASAVDVRVPVSGFNYNDM